MDKGKLFCAEIACAAADAFFSEFAGFRKFSKGRFHGAYGKGRAEFADVLLGEAADFLQSGAAYGFQGGVLCFYECKAVSEIFVGRKDGAQKVVDEGDGIVHFFVPADLAFAEGAVVEIFVFGDFSFKGYVFPDVKTVLIEE